MHNILWTAEEAVLATGGYTTVTWQATGVAIDSRNVTNGDLFIALSGPHYDGHDFVASALENGATAAVVERLPARAKTSSRLLLVKNTRVALHALAYRALARSKATVLAVTGSVGKTSTKEMLKLALKQSGSVHANDGNLNNYLGVPLTLARMPTSTRFVILEMGMSQAGELALLSLFARPDVAIITTVEAVHLAFFGSTLAIADAKSEVFLGMSQKQGGVAILNRDNPHFGRLLQHATAAGVPYIYSFGSHQESTMRLLDYTIIEEGTVVKARILQRDITYLLGIHGHHAALNSLAVLATVKAVGARTQPAIDAMVNMRALAGHGAHQRLTLRRDGGNIVVIDESYNASPAAVIAALAVLGARQLGPGGRRIAVLGDMLELGVDGIVLHTMLVSTLYKSDVDLVFTTGPLMKHLYEALPLEKRGGHAATSTELAEQVVTAVRSGDIVLVKGSSNNKMNTIVTALQAISSRE